MSTFDYFISAYRCQTDNMHRHCLSPSCQIKLNKTSKIILHYVVTGNCTIRGNKFSLKASADDIVIFPHGSAHHLCNENEQKSGQVTNLLSGSFQLELHNTNPLLQKLPTFVVLNADIHQQHKSVIRLLETMAEELDQDEIGCHSIGNRCAEAILVYLFRGLSAVDSHTTNIMSAFNDPRINKALSAFHACFSHSWTLQELATEAGMSRSAFASLFRQKMDTTPIAYITQWRMQWAATRIRDQQDKISTVAFQSGYRSEVSFSRAFKAHFGYSPSTLKHDLNAA